MEELGEMRIGARVYRPDWDNGEDRHWQLAHLFADERDAEEFDATFIVQAGLPFSIPRALERYVCDCGARLEAFEYGVRLWSVRCCADPGHQSSDPSRPNIIRGPSMVECEADQAVRISGRDDRL